MTITPYSHVIEAAIAYGEVIEALAEGRARAKARGVEFAWMFDTVGEMGAAAAEFTISAAEKSPPDGLVAFGLSGLEAGVDRAHYADVFDRARALGLWSVPHAGEADGPASVWAALGFLRADRIGHGVRAIEDDRLVAHLVEHKIPLEICPSSNVCTRAYPTLAEHPLPQLLEAGVIVTVNTDDPPMFATSLNEEYLRVSEAFSFGLETVAALFSNGVRSSFLDATAKVRLLIEIETTAAQFRS